MNKFIFTGVLSVVFNINHTFAQNSLMESPSLVPLSSVNVQVQRALMTQSGAYLLQLGSGYWNPKGTLYDVKHHQITSLMGLQKGDQITMTGGSTTDRESVADAIQLQGALDVETGIYRATLMDRLQGFKQELIFSPLVKVSNRPTFLLKFYGNENKESGDKIIQKIEVIDRKTKQPYQSLAGFSAYSSQVQYVDLNFDGYFDLVLKDTSSILGEGDRSIYWMYNPETKKFQRSPQLETLGGTPIVNIEKHQVSFGDGQLYIIQDGQFYRIKN
ncbi:XAC2610-related protein [Acinetobacter equi]|uniref:Uncharacterized protein n=1 Tax=Acinetobacter equi TaxID=1324350 RepID=A0A0N9VZZ9_9GAMM|nr:hypothetical protein [Acinetobacter equi]ALH94324.1 hypothetical protein AOY20_01520 [Acinetobacter equi]